MLENKIHSKLDDHSQNFEGRQRIAPTSHITSHYTTFLINAGRRSATPSYYDTAPPLAHYTTVLWEKEEEEISNEREKAKQQIDHNKEKCLTAVLAIVVLTTITTISITARHQPY